MIHTTELDIPKLTRKVTKESKYAFQSLQAGSKTCLVETNLEDGEHKVRSRVQSALMAYKQRTGDARKFTVRPTDMDGKRVIGVWCIAEAETAA